MVPSKTGHDFKEIINRPPMVSDDNTTETAEVELTNGNTVENGTLDNTTQNGTTDTDKTEKHE